VVALGLSSFNVILTSELKSRLHGAGSVCNEIGMRKSAGAVAYQRICQRFGRLVRKEGSVNISHAPGLLTDYA
jgi:hypothetical protein